MTEILTRIRNAVRALRGLPPSGGAQPMGGGGPRQPGK